MDPKQLPSLHLLPVHVEGKVQTAGQALQSIALDPAILNPEVLLKTGIYPLLSGHFSSTFRYFAIPHAAPISSLHYHSANEHRIVLSAGRIHTGSRHRFKRRPITALPQIWRWGTIMATDGCSGAVRAPGSGGPRRGVLPASLILWQHPRHAPGRRYPCVHTDS